MADPMIFILLPVHNRRQTTQHFVECLLAQSYRRWHLILIDDGSVDGTTEMVRSHIPNATVIRGSGRWWWAGALQQGFRWLKKSRARPDDLVLIMNDDTQFGSNLLASAVRALKPRALLLAQCYALASGEFIEAGVKCDWRDLTFISVADTQEANCFSTRGLFLHAGDVIEIGGFHPFFLPHYLSDYEYTMRAHRKGFALISSPDVWLYSDLALTGTRHVDNLSLPTMLELMRTPKWTGNPIYWTIFILMICERRYVWRNLLRIWRSIFREVRAARKNAALSAGERS